MPEVNIGLNTPQGQKLKPQDVIDALRDSGVDATNYKVLQGDAGPTFVGTLNKHLNPYEANAVAEALGQECIAQHMGGGIGDVFGPEKEKWGNFDPTRFIQPNGKSVEENLQKAGLRQMPDETPFWPPEINRPRQEKKQEMRTPGGGYVSAEEAARGPEIPKPPMRTPGGLYLEPTE